MLELVSTLIQRKEYQLVRRNLKVGEVVLVISADVPRGQWSLGHAIEVFEGDDGFLRVVKVQIGGSVVTCSITKICQVEVNEGNQNITTVFHGQGE